MPVIQVKLAALPKSKRQSKVANTLEYQEIEELLVKLPKDEALRVSLSKETVSQFKNKSMKVAIAAFRQRLLSELEYKSKFRVSVIGEEIIIRYRTEKGKGK